MCMLPTGNRWSKEVWILSSNSGTKEPLDEGDRGERKNWFKIQLSKN